MFSGITYITELLLFTISNGTLLRGDGTFLRLKSRLNGRAHNAHELSAFRLVVLLGVVSLFADMTFDGAVSIVGPYLAGLGATAVFIAFIAGFGELVAYTPRLASGYFIDHTGRYWTIMIIGYFINLVAIPCLALVGQWQTAAGLIILERVGKAMRAPARDAIISHAAKGMGGIGRAFGLHEALSQIGSMIGPVMISLILALKFNYQFSFAMLAIPAAMAVAILVLTIKWYPKPMELEKVQKETCAFAKGKKLPRVFWIYLSGAALVAAGFVDFPLISFHLQSETTIEAAWIPILYAMAMGVDALAALVLGHFYDRHGITTLLVALPIAAFFMPLVFGTDIVTASLGMVLWGIGMGAVESVMRGAVAEMVPMERRAVGYGIYATGFGVFWFLGSAGLGILYVVSIPAMMAASVVMIMAAVVIFAWVRREMKCVQKSVAKEEKQST